MRSLSALLEKHGLGKYTKVFLDHSIEIDVLSDLTDADLEKFGVPLGDRRRILKLAKDPAPEEHLERPLGRHREVERRQLTVMFADLVDSTNLVAKTDPEDIKDLISKYQTAVSKEVVYFGGFVAKPLGDGLLIYFGWPRAHEDDATRAVRSAISVIAAVGKLSTPAGAKLSARIGIATGEVVVGDFDGAGVNEEGAVIGEAPNLAARLQALASENGIVIAERTLRLIGLQFVFTDLGEQVLKGFEAPVRAWRVEGERPAQTRFHALRGSRLGKFIGREHEIGLMNARWGEACDGECQLLLIAGEAGIGKSKLVSEFLTSLAGEPLNQIWYQASPLHTNTALYPVVRQLEAGAGVGADDSAGEKYRKLAVTLPGQTPRDRVALKYLSDLMSLESPEGDGRTGPESTANEQREAAFAALVDAIGKEAAATPQLIVMEDAHWLDATTQEFLDRILDRLQHHRVMVLVTYRPEFVPPWAQHANVGLLSLSRLGKRSSHQIVTSLISSAADLSPEAVDEIVAKSDGIPLFVEELTGSALDSARSSAGGVVRIPSTLRDALSERLDRLGSAKEVAQIASAFGREFSPELVAETLGRVEADLNGDLDRLMAIDIVFQSSRTVRRYVFRHALLQDAAYESMLKSKRREVHCRIADVLTKRRPELAESEPEVMASHLARAGRAADASDYWRKAGDLALRKSAYQETIGAFRGALDNVPDSAEKAHERIHINRAIATAYFAVADIQSVRKHLEKAAEDAARSANKILMAEIAIQQCHVLNIYGGRLEDGRKAGQRALAIAVELQDEPLAYGARFALGQSYWAGGEMAEGIRLFTGNLPENLTDAESVRDFATAGSLMINSMVSLGACYGCRGEFERALELFERATRKVSERTNNAFDRMVVLGQPARVLLIKGDATAAIPLLEEACEHCERAALMFALPWQRGFLGYARALTGRVDEGISLMAEALRDCQAKHLLFFGALINSCLIQTLLDNGREGVLEAASESLALAKSLGYRAQEAQSLRVLGAALIKDGSDYRQAEAHVRSALSLAVQLGLRPEEAHALRALSHVQSAQGRNEESYRNIVLARSIYEELKMDYWLQQ